MSFLRIPAALIGTFVLVGVATAAADPKQLDCTLTDPGSRSVSSQQTENRPVTVFDEAAGTLSVSRDGTTRALSHVTMTQSSVTGYLDDQPRDRPRSVEYRAPDLRRSFDARRIRNLQIAMKRARLKEINASRSASQLRWSLRML